MNKVICDVCGTDYPETAAQCPICGCATVGGQTSLGETAPGEENSGYTYTKGGRFSKSNVRKRLKASQVQESRIVVPEPEYADDEEDEEEDELEQEEESSNRGLIIIVVLLLLAIVAVSVYIAISIFGVGAGDDSGSNNNPIVQTNETAAPTESTTNQVPCTSLVLGDREINFMSSNSAWDLGVSVEPADTTDVVEFSSADESVAKVDPVSGRVTAVGTGETVIIVKCGDITVECPVTCSFAAEPTDPSTEATDPSESTDVTDATDGTDPSDTTEAFVLELNRKPDFTLYIGERHQLYDGDIPASEITWTSADEEIATVKNGLVTAVGAGRTDVYAEYQGQKVSCGVFCRVRAEDVTEPPTAESTEPTTETTEPTTETTEPTAEATEPTTETTEPTETAGGYVLRKNGAKCTYGDDYTAHATIKVGESFKLAIVDSNNTTQDVVWSASKEGICTVTGTTVKGAAAGNVTLSVSLGGKTYRCYLIVK